MQYKVDMTEAHTLSLELDRLSKRPTALLNQEYWFPFAVFGVLSLIGAAVFATWNPDDTGSGLYWAVAGPAGGIATSWWFARRGTSLGVRPKRVWVYPAIAVALFVSASLVGALAPTEWVLPGVLCVVGVAFGAYGLLDRSPLVTVVGSGVAVIGVAAGAGELEAVVISLLLGGFLLAAAAAYRLS